MRTGASALVMPCALFALPLQRKLVLAHLLLVLHIALLCLALLHLALLHFSLVQCTLLHLVLVDRARHVVAFRMVFAPRRL